jgi:hypothetical protein
METGVWKPLIKRILYRFLQKKLFTTLINLIFKHESVSNPGPSGMDGEKLVCPSGEITPSFCSCPTGTL